MTYPDLARLASRYRLVLGSRSPRRVELLRDAGIAFIQRIPDIEENPRPGEPAYEYAVRLAEEKALEIAAGCEPGDIVLGCDTIVVLGDHILEKPADTADAHRLLSQLSGQQHIVCSALALAGRRGVLKSGHELTKVYFHPVTSQQIHDYIRSGEPMDKAGAYGIQGMGSFLVDRIEGNLDTVVGLPRSLLDRLAGEVLLG
ncbi:septum formation protein Maf [candidate division GN15 bacterium]|uniref:dTTP/UTP pyrophosphatase n=1 Tax=candidate division GN15 bacterium TaxID=2072418 RepID=A0A855X337_9BACT|nr:MAG: septum formation protein Maf [candidate division GN15 bacterium]